MKRSQLQRKTALRPVSQKQRQHLQILRDDPRRDEFKRIWWDHCQVCGTEGYVRNHHVVYEQACRREGGDLWDLRNALVVGVELTCQCHSRQHSAVERIPLKLVSNEALEFAVELLGQFPAALYLAAHYDGEMT